METSIMARAYGADRKRYAAATELTYAAPTLSTSGVETSSELLSTPEVETYRDINMSKMHSLDRRAFLIGGLTVVGASALSRIPLLARPRWIASPFTLGVASGDPEATSVVIWTRLAPDPLTNGGGMSPDAVEVGWEVASDDAMTKIVRKGRTTAVAAAAHTVHVDVEGLEPARHYWYRFTAGDAVSRIGRTRTLVRPDARADRLRFAFASCQHYETGFFTPYKHMAAEDLDLVFHLGDYIYEGPGREGQIRKHIGAELATLDDYRNRYAQYRLDPDLQTAHALFPFVVTPDDHEVDNNYAGDFQERDDPRDAFLQRRAGAYQAYYEHMPLRRRSVPSGPSIQLYRQFSYGQLASFFVLDTRQYRTNQPCGDGTKVVCPEVLDPNATILGAAQERWLTDGMTRSRGQWNVIPQQVMIAKVDQAPGDEARYSMDQWPGYEVSRVRLMELFASKKVTNPVVLTGDIHSNWVNDLKVDPRDNDRPAVGTEFVGTSITSGGDGSDTTARMTNVLAENPSVKFYNTQRGYVSCTVTPKDWRADYQIVEFVRQPDAPKKTRASFLVRDGKPGAERL
jgi:alkaline phosphatase D